MNVVNKKIHFSVDDTFGCFKWLNRNSESVNEIFSSNTFCYAKFIYEIFGIGTTFYCMYTDGMESLDMIDSKWSEQFQKYSAWMKFGFHGYDDGSNYNMASMGRFADDYEKVKNALKNITGGGKCFADTLRLHCFGGNETIAAYLKKDGINNLLCADDDRGSYGLPKEAEACLKRTGTFLDVHTGMRYIATNLRLENINDIENEVQKIQRSFYNNVVIFTHERYLRDIEIRKRLEGLLREII